MGNQGCKRVRETGSTCPGLYELSNALWPDTWFLTGKKLQRPGSVDVCPQGSGTLLARCELDRHNVNRQPGRAWTEMGNRVAYARLIL